MACSDNIGVTQEDLEKHSWLKPFILEHSDLSGEHNLDLGTLEFTYHYLQSDAQFSNEINEAILLDNWALNETSNGWNIKKEIYTFEDSSTLISMKIVQDKEDNRAYFVVSSGM